MDIKTIDNKAEYTYTEKKSQFIGYSFPLEDFESIDIYIDEIREKHKNSSHLVYAYTFGIQNVKYKYYDAGEPSGTAGMPLYSVISGEGLSNVLVIVVRYFGGTKLGTGNLAKAYGETCKNVLGKSTIVCKNLCEEYKLLSDYTNFSMTEKTIEKYGGLIHEKIFLENIEILFYVKKNKSDLLKKELSDIYSGNIIIELIDEKFLQLKM